MRNVYVAHVCCAQHARILPTSTWHSRPAMRKKGTKRAMMEETMDKSRDSGCVTPMRENKRYKNSRLAVYIPVRTKSMLLIFLSPILSSLDCRHQHWWCDSIFPSLQYSAIRSVSETHRIRLESRRWGTFSLSFLVSTASFFFKGRRRRWSEKEWVWGLLDDEKMFEFFSSLFCCSILSHYHSRTTP